MNRNHFLKEMQGFLSGSYWFSVGNVHKKLAEPFPAGILVFLGFLTVPRLARGRGRTPSPTATSAAAEVGASRRRPCPRPTQRSDFTFARSHAAFPFVHTRYYVFTTFPYIQYYSSDYWALFPNSILLEHGINIMGIPFLFLFLFGLDINIIGCFIPSLWCTTPFCYCFCLIILIIACHE